MQRLLLAMLVCTVAWGCARHDDSPGGNVQDLASALRREGIAYHATETAALASIQAEGLRLMGPDLVVEVYALRGRRGARQAEEAAGLLNRQGAAGTSAPRAYVRGHFLVVVRREPVEGAVAAALDRIFAG
jgi:hypothetical protein